MINHGFEPIEVRWLRRLHKWAGEIQPERKRITFCDFGALTARVMKCKHILFGGPGNIQE